MLNFTNKWLFPGILWSLFALNAIAQHSDKEVKEDVARHRAMAAAHEARPSAWSPARRPMRATRNFRPVARVWPLANTAA
jgi:hypothetical protein